MVTSPDLPIVAMLRAPKLWPEPHSTVEGQLGDATAAVPLSPVSETKVYPPGSTVVPSLAAMDTQTGNGSSSPGEDIKGIISTQPVKAEHPNSSQWASVDRTMTVDPVPSGTTAEPTSIGGAVGSEPGVSHAADSPTSGPVVTVDEVPGTWSSSHSNGSVPSAPPGDPGVLMSGVTPSLGPWGTSAGASVSRIDSTVVPDPSDSGGLWESGPHVVEGARSHTLSPQVAVHTDVVTLLPSLDQAIKVEVLTTSTLTPSSSQHHLEADDQMVAQGTLGPSAPPPLGSPPGKPVLPSWTTTVASMDEAASVSSGETLGPWGSPSALLPVSLGTVESELEVVAGRPGMEGFWEEAASGEEPALPGTPANRSADEGEFQIPGFHPAQRGQGWGPRAGGERVVPWDFGRESRMHECRTGFISTFVTGFRWGDPVWGISVCHFQQGHCSLPFKAPAGSGEHRVGHRRLLGGAEGEKLEFRSTLGQGTLRQWVPGRDRGGRRHLIL
jgi:neurocan core protein